MAYFSSFPSTYSTGGSGGKSQVRERVYNGGGLILLCTQGSLLQVVIRKLAER